MERMRDIETVLRGCASDFNADSLTCTEAAVLVKQCTAIENMAATMKALAARRAAQSGQWKRSGHRSAAEQLAHATGTSVADAKDTLTRGDNLDAQPDVAAAALDGKLSARQASAIADAAVVNPDAASKLLDAAAAGGSLADLKAQCGQAKAEVIDREARRREIHARRHLRQWTDSDGEAHLSASGNPEDLAHVASFLEPLADAEFDKARREGRREHPNAYRLDALVNYCAAANSAAGTGDPDASTAGDEDGSATGSSSFTPDDDSQGDEPADSADGSGDEPAGSPGDRCASSSDKAPADTPSGGQADLASEWRPPGDSDGDAASAPPRASSGGSIAPRGRGPSSPRPNGKPKNKAPAGRRRRTGAPAKLIIRVDLDAFLRGSPIGEEVCDLVGHGPIAGSALRDLLNRTDPFVAAILTKGRQVAGVVHLGRKPTAYQKTVLEWLYPSCAALGCPATGRLQTDHRVDWAATHITLVDWLDQLCDHDHDKKTRYGWALVDGVGKRPFVPPDDPRHPKYHAATTGARE